MPDVPHETRVFRHDTRELGRVVSSGAGAASDGDSEDEDDQEGQGGSSRARKSHYDYLVLLNYTLSRCTRRLWHMSRGRLCADGGANRLLDELPLMLADSAAATARERFVPDTIIGDMDSIRDDVKAHYHARGARLVDLSADQDSTDLKKCIRHITEMGATSRASIGADASAAATVVVVGALGGRLDHELANLSTLYEYHCPLSDAENGTECCRPRVNIIIVSDESIAYVLPKGTNYISLDPRHEGPSCGLIPLQSPARVTTTGLRWNCNGTLLAFGVFMSTSNIITQGDIVVSTDAPLLWTTSVRSV